MEQRSASHAQRSQCNNFLFIIPRHMPRSKAHKSRREFRCCAADVTTGMLYPQPSTKRNAVATTHSNFLGVGARCHPCLACFAVSVPGMLRCSLLDREKALACSSVRPARPLPVGPGGSASPSLRWPALPCARVLVSELRRF
jgi:hypothetical protein